MTDQLIDPPEHGRIYALTTRAGLGDCAPSGRARLDALARWLQDVAYADVEDAGVAGDAIWVVRRHRIVVDRFPQFGERYELRTFCSGVGRMWAERRTTLVHIERRTPDVESVAVWVHLDPASRRPAPFTEAEMRVYGATAGDRRISARLQHPPPPENGAEQARWSFRPTELDLADHVNNAAYWQPLEARLLEVAEPDQIDAEIEFRTPAQPGDKLVVTQDDRLWILGPGGELHASLHHKQK